MLTGPAIKKAIEDGDIQIDPFVPEHVGPNSIDLRLRPELMMYDLHARHGEEVWFKEGEIYLGSGTPKVLDARKSNRTFEVGIPDKGWVLNPGVLYLASTVERIHSKVYSSTIHGRSSVGRLGIVVHQTAAFIDVGFDGKITLEITCVHPVRIYAGMRIAQLAFHPLSGTIELYRGKYQGATGVEASKMHLDKETGLSLVENLDKLYAKGVRSSDLRDCEPCGGPGPCLWDPSTHQYCCVSCHSEPSDPFWKEQRR